MNPDQSGQVEMGGHSGAEVEALSSLAHLDGASNNAIVGLASSTINTVIAYLGVTIFVVVGPTGVPTVILPFLPLPILLLQSYQMVQAAAAMRKAASQEIIEQRLASVAGLSNEWRQGRIGSRASEPYVNIHHIATLDPFRRLTRTFAASFPYAGFYGLAVAYTAYVLHLTGSLAPLGFQDPLFQWPLFAYIVTWVILAIVAVDTLLLGGAKPKGIPAHFSVASIMLLFLAPAAVAYQFIDRTDPFPPFAYYTVWSAALLVPIELVAGYFKHRIWQIAHLVVSVACILSGVVFWAALAPALGIGETAAQQLGNILIHGIVPLLLVLSYWVDSRVTPGFAHVLGWSLVPPGLYGVAVLLWQVFGSGSSPYLFLSLTDFGFPGVALSYLAIGLATLALATLLKWMSVVSCARNG